MTNKELCEKLIKLSTGYKTLYVMGGFGASASEKNKERYTKNYEYNKQPDRAYLINEASKDTFFFDCVGMIKSMLWGFDFDKDKVYGGATYCANDVSDIGTETMYNLCLDRSNKFGDIQKGELVHLQGHVGIYIGDGLVVECSPAWANGVQITACNKEIAGYNTRKWSGHGKLPWVEYEKEERPEDAFLKQVQNNIVETEERAKEFSYEIEPAPYDEIAPKEETEELTWWQKLIKILKLIFGGNTNG